MSPRELQQVILSSDLLPTEKLVGFCILFHINSKTQQTKLKKSTIAYECGVSTRSVRRAVLSLIKYGIIEEEIDSGRSSFYRIPSSNNTSTVTHDTHVTGGMTKTTRCTSLKYDLDTEFSTPVEEQNKREDARIQRDNADDLGLLEV